MAESNRLDALHRTLTGIVDGSLQADADLHRHLWNDMIALLQHMQGQATGKRDLHQLAQMASAGAYLALLNHYCMATTSPTEHMPGQLYSESAWVLSELGGGEAYGQLLFRLAQLHHHIALTHPQKTVNASNASRLYALAHNAFGQATPHGKVITLYRGMLLSTTDMSELALERLRDLTRYFSRVGRLEPHFAAVLWLEYMSGAAPEPTSRDLLESLRGALPNHVLRHYEEVAQETPAGQPPRLWLRSLGQPAG